MKHELKRGAPDEEIETTPVTDGEVTFPFQNNPACRHVLQMFSLFANEYRFKILCILSQGDFCVQTIVDTLGAKYSNVSQQLKMLALAGYINRERRNKQIFYRLESQEIRELLDYLKSRYA